MTGVVIVLSVAFAVMVMLFILASRQYQRQYQQSLRYWRSLQDAYRELDRKNRTIRNLRENYTALYETMYTRRETK